MCEAFVALSDDRSGTMVETSRFSQSASAPLGLSSGLRVVPVASEMRPDI